MCIVEKQPTSMASESYKTLRTNIEYSFFDKSLKVILVTSSDIGEGKTTVASNLALSLAQDEKKVILIDANLRMPNIHKEFLVANKTGLSAMLIGKNFFEDTKIKISNYLDIITSGHIPPNPSEMIGSGNMTKLIEDIKEDYDYVILDAPAILPVTDAQILSTIADGTILVVKAQKTKKDNVINAKKLLDKVKANIIGIVFNGTEIKKTANKYGEEKSVKIVKKAKKIKGFKRVKKVKKELGMKLENQ